MLFIQIFNNNFENLIPELFLSFNILFLLLFSIIFSQNNKKKNYIFFEFFYKLIIYILFLLLYLYFNIYEYPIIILFNMFYYNTNIKLLKIIIIFLTLCFFINITKILKNIYKFYYFEFLLLILFSLLGLFLTISSYNFLILYLSLELFSLCFYILVASNKNSNLSLEAALKYFIYGSFASGLILYGISLIYGLTGIINFNDFFNLFYFTSTITTFTLNFALFLIFSGLFFKIGVVPFHTWLPDVYEGSLISITMFFTLIPKLIIFYIISLCFFILFLKIIPTFQVLIQYLILLSLIIGIFGTILQKKIKRLFAYSTISHTGFLLFVFLTPNILNLKYLFIYLFIYTIINLLLWLIFIYLKININLKYITDLTGIYKINILLIIYLSFIFFSIAGIPPFIGFFSKYFILLFAIKESFFLISFIAIILSSLSAFYYLRFIKIMFFEKSYNFKYIKIISKEYAFIISVCFFINCNFFFYGQFF